MSSRLSGVCDTSGLGQGQREAQSTCCWWRGLECETLGYAELTVAFLSCFNLLRNLNPENELKRYFGARAVLGDQRLVEDLILNLPKARVAPSVHPLPAPRATPAFRASDSFSSRLLGPEKIFLSCGEGESETSPDFC